MPNLSQKFIQRESKVISPGYLDPIGSRSRHRNHGSTLAKPHFDKTPAKMRRCALDCLAYSDCQVNKGARAPRLKPGSDIICTADLAISESENFLLDKKPNFIEWLTFWRAVGARLKG